MKTLLFICLLISVSTSVYFASSSPECGCDQAKQEQLQRWHDSIRTVIWHDSSVKAFQYRMDSISAR